MRVIKVTYSDGTEITTSMSEHLTDDQMLKYFSVGKTFNIGSVEDNIQTVTKTEIIK